MHPEPSVSPKYGRKHRILLRLERFSREHYKLVFVVAAVLAVTGAWLGTQLKLESDILALIPAGNRNVDTFKAAIDDFGSISYLVVLFEAREGAAEDELEDFADLVADRLTEREDLIERVEYRFDLDTEFLELFYENALLFLPPEDLPTLREKLEDSAILRQIEQNRLSLSSPTAALTQDLMLNDPLNLMPLFLTRLMGKQGLLKVDLSDGYYLSRDGRTLIMLVKPTQPWQELGFNKELLTAARGIEQDVRDEISGDGQDRSGVNVRYGGHYAMAVDESALIREDVQFNLIFSLLAVSALYFLCYRRFAALLYSSVPLLVGQALTFGLAFFVLRSLNASSSAFTALLMGLGTDFVIVMYARYVEERRAGKSLAEATERMVGETGLGVFTGAITSAGTFYAMCISEFRGLLHLGILIGSGILLCAVAIVFLVPAMITWNEGARPRKVDSVKKLYVQSFGLERLIPFSARHPKLVITLTVLVTLGSGYLATQLEFDDTVQVLRSNRSPAYQVQREVSEKFGASLSFMMAIAHGKTKDEALQRVVQIEQRLKPFVENGIVTGSDSVLNYLPPEPQQREILTALGTRDGTLDPERIRNTFVRGLQAAGFNQAAFEPFLGRMERFLAPSRPIGLTDLEQRGLERLVERYVLEDADGVRIVTYLSMSDPRWKRRSPPGLIESVTAGDPNIVVTGTNVVSSEFRRIFSREAPRAVLLGLIVVLVLLLFDFRDLRLTAIAMAQLFCGVVMMFGLMKVADVHLNYVNAFVATMILGVGIDYSIHLIHRMSLTGGEVESGLLETGKAVVIAALTNIAAFGTLMLGNYPALRSFGQVAMFGSLTCLLTSLTLVPALMARIGGTQQSRGDR